jgi:hypothetical protein
MVSSASCRTRSVFGPRWAARGQDGHWECRGRCQGPAGGRTHTCGLESSSRCRPRRIAGANLVSRHARRPDGARRRSESYAFFARCSKEVNTRIRITRSPGGAAAITTALAQGIVRFSVILTRTMPSFSKTQRMVRRTLCSRRILTRSTASKPKARPGIARDLMLPIGISVGLAARLPRGAAAARRGDAAAAAEAVRCPKRERAFRFVDGLDELLGDGIGRFAHHCDKESTSFSRAPRSFRYR